MYYVHSQYPDVILSKRVTELDIERRALWAGLFCSLFGLIVGFIVFAGTRPAIFGSLSVGAVSAVTGAVSAGTSSAYAFRTMLRAREPWLKRIPKWRQVMVALGLVLVHVASTVMILLVVFHLFQQAFYGLHLDVLAGSLAVAAATGIAAYLSLEATARINAETLSVVLGIFMAAGVLISMLLAEDQGWWKSMFSSLGTTQAGMGSFWTFNLTLVISGLVLAAFAEFLTRDLVRLSQTYRCRPSLERYKLARMVRPRPRIVRWCLLLVAVAIIGIGMVPYNLSIEGHSAFVQLASISMIILLLGTVVLLPGYPAVFHLLSYTAVGAIWVAFLLWTEWSYYNLTGFELSVVAILFSWISVFIRTTSAMTQDRLTPRTTHSPSEVAKKTKSS
ncbi:MULTISPECIES: hypothetical protein [Glutamicibacter]|uniref:DUF998 domain-containing protein n=1 Tax=Glutamicibacter arilaitensis TaxID=256701 RepID=A0A2N7RXK5_9MICC|nr:MULTISPECIES: hypothetical protein [Glutamicibacter]PMQ18613.1 hypothetical protein CIK84_17560 [Glutamicibacter arilaitensis]HCJ53761.1 hypothetical protein [Glutamicibacter sp.]